MSTRRSARFGYTAGTRLCFCRPARGLHGVPVFLPLRGQLLRPRFCPLILTCPVIVLPPTADSDKHSEDRAPRRHGNSARLLAGGSVAGSARSGAFSTAHTLLHRSKSARAGSRCHLHHVRPHLPSDRLITSPRPPCARASAPASHCTLSLVPSLSDAGVYGKTPQRAGRGTSSAGDHRRV